MDRHERLARRAKRAEIWTPERLTEIRAAGFRTGKAGGSKSSNPYRYLTKGYWTWLEGYESGFKAKERVVRRFFRKELNQTPAPDALIQWAE